MVRAGAPWRMLPRDLPPRQIVYPQRQRWLAAGVFESLVHDLRELLRVATGRNARPSAAILPRRWVVERSFAWAGRFRRLARDYERLPGTVAGLGVFV